MTPWNMMSWIMASWNMKSWHMRSGNMTLWHKTSWPGFFLYHKFDIVTWFSTKFDIMAYNVMIYVVMKYNIITYDAMTYDVMTYVIFVFLKFVSYVPKMSMFFLNMWKLCEKDVTFTENVIIYVIKIWFSYLEGLSFSITVKDSL